MSSTNRHVAPRRDKTPWLIALGAAIVSVLAYWVTARHSAVLTYTDAISHMEIARRVVRGATPSFAQLGSVWLPLPHLAMLPFIWVDSLYTNGFAGAIVSMVAYVGAVVLIYKITHQLTGGKKFASIIAAIIFGINVNMMYLQSTPMTEALLFATMLAAVYYVQQWAFNSHPRNLIKAGVWALLSTLARYESWPILMGLTVAVVAIAWCRHSMLKPKGDNGHKPSKLNVPGKGTAAVRRRNPMLWMRTGSTADKVIAFGMAAFAGIGGWAVYNWAIFGSPTNFQNGEYAKPSIWVPKGELAVHNWSASGRTYWYAMVDDITLPVLILAMIGLVAFLVFELRRGTTTRTLPVLSLLIPVPFFILCLWTGQRPLHVAQVTGDLYNTRYGLIMLMPVAIFIGYLVGCIQQRVKIKLVGIAVGALVLAGTLLVNGSLLHKGDIITYRDPAIGLTSDITHQQYNAMDAFNQNYHGGRVLMESFGNEQVGRIIPSEQWIYEGSYHLWDPALSDPAGHQISTIVMRCGSSPDKVCKHFHGKTPGGYKLAYEGANANKSTIYRIFTRQK
ncbi:MAG TPA: glycosyltransferase family 39 protein [Candidatus Saccharimonadales bacterium]|nr:glycosyltransferase family 39 protein [Candidatus Saccharimonadales bacterium]